MLQKRAAESVAAFIQFCNSSLFTGKVNPCDKVVKNLFTFLCQDTTVTPVFSTGLGSTDGIITLKEDKPAPSKKSAAGFKDVPEESERQIADRLTRRGAQEAFRAMAKRFGQKLFKAVPKFWEGISDGLLAQTADCEWMI